MQQPQILTLHVGQAAERMSTYLKHLVSILHCPSIRPESLALQRLQKQKLLEVNLAFRTLVSMR